MASTGVLRHCQRRAFALGSQLPLSGPPSPPDAFVVVRVRLVPSQPSSYGPNGVAILDPTTLYGKY